MSWVTQVWHQINTKSTNSTIPSTKMLYCRCLFSVACQNILMPVLVAFNLFCILMWAIIRNIQVDRGMFDTRRVC